MKKPRLRAAISGIVSFFLFLLSVITALVIGLRVTAFDSDFIIRRLDNAYYTSLAKTLKDNLLEYAPSSQLPDTIFDDLFTESMLKQDTDTYIREVFRGSSKTFDDTHVRNLLSEHFTAYAEKNGIAVEKESLEHLLDLCVTTYEQQIQIPLLSSYDQIRGLFLRVFPTVLIVSGFILIAMLAFLFSIHPVKYKALRYCIISASASALMILPVAIGLIVWGGYKTIAISPAHLQILLGSSIHTVLLSFVTAGVLFVLGAVLAAIGYKLASVKAAAVLGKKDSSHLQYEGASLGQ